MECLEGRGRFFAPRLGAFIGMILVAFMIIGVFGKEVSAQPSGGFPSLGPQQLVALDFDNADIRVVIKQISELIKRNFLVDEKVRGKVTIITPRKIRIRDVYRVFLSMLHTYGFTAVPAGAVTKIIPLGDVTRTGIAIISPAEAARLPASDRIVTTFIQLDHADSGALVSLLRPLAAREGSLIAYQPANAIIMTDTASNVRRITSIIRSVDLPFAGAKVEVIRLKFAIAKDLAQMMNQMIETGPTTRRTVRQRPARPGAPRAGAGLGASSFGRGQVKIIPDDRTNSIIMVASASEIFRFRSLIKKMDIPPPPERKRIHVYRLKNALAEELANVLNQQVLESGGRGKKKASPGRPAPRQPTGAIPVSNVSGTNLLEDVVITPDKATNSLIVRASPEDYLSLTEIIRKLDIQRSQVLVEALIAEMTLDKATELGIEWRLLNQPRRKGTSIIGGTNFASSTGAGLINQFVNSAFAGPTGLVLGAARGTITIGDQVFADLRGVIRAFQGDSDVNIISTPQILTMDNEEAEIIVGENRPFVTQSQSSAEGTTTIQTFEFRDVGVTLRITPHISPNRYVRMKIFQEILSFVAESEVGAVITTKRQATTTVAVEDGQTVVIGGLIRDDKVKTVSKVPLLGDVPILGALFRAERESKVKTNLLIFITPRVINSPEEHRRLTEMKREKVEQLFKTKGNSIKERM